MVILRHKFKAVCKGHEEQCPFALEDLTSLIILRTIGGLSYLDVLALWAFLVLILSRLSLSHNRCTGQPCGDTGLQRQGPTLPGRFSLFALDTPDCVHCRKRRLDTSIQCPQVCSEQDMLYHSRAKTFNSGKDSPR